MGDHKFVYEPEPSNSDTEAASNSRFEEEAAPAPASTFEELPQHPEALTADLPPETSGTNDDDRDREAGERAQSQMQTDKSLPHAAALTAPKAAEYEKELHKLYDDLERLFGQKHERVSDLEVVQDGELIAHVTRRPTTPAPKTTPSTTRVPRKYNVGPNYRPRPSGNWNSNMNRFRRPPPNLNPDPDRRRPQALVSIPLQRDPAPYPQQPQFWAQPNNENAIDNRPQPAWFSHDADLAVAPVDFPDADPSLSNRLTEIGSQIAVDEDKLLTPMAVVVQDDKVRAELDVEPLGARGERKRKPHHSRKFTQWARRFLKRKYGPDHSKDNFLQKEVFKLERSVGNLIHPPKKPKYTAEERQRRRRRLRRHKQKYRRLLKILREKKIRLH